METRSVLVLAGTGKTGRRVATGLTDRGLVVRIGSRRGEPPFDWHDQDTWKPALRGVDAAYVAYYPDAAFPGAADTVGAFADLAVHSGVRRLVLLADRGAAEAERCEQALRESGAEWTIVRSGFITQNFSEGFLAEAIRGGVVALPAGDVAEPFTDADDIADVVVAALTEHGHVGSIHELTGPRLLTFSDAVSEIAKETGTHIRYRPVSLAEFTSMLIERGTPASEAHGLAGLLDEVFDGHRAHLTDGVRCAINRAPRDFRDYVRQTAATGVWNSR